MTHAIVLDRCIDAARGLSVRLRRAGVHATAVHPTDFDRTFEADGIPHLVVTELAMSPLSGLDLIREVRGEWRREQLPIVAYTTVDEPAVWAEARAAGANEVVGRSGPDPVKRLEAAIARCLNRHDPEPPPTRPMGMFARLFARPAVALAA